MMKSYVLNKCNLLKCGYIIKEKKKVRKKSCAHAPFIEQHYARRVKTSVQMVYCKQ